MKSFIFLIALLALSIPCALAQETELGVTAGSGVFGAEDAGLPYYATVGVEVCAICSGSFGLFGEYNHWEYVASGYQSARIGRVDLVAGGLRIQSGRAVRPFFDVGLAGGWDHFSFRGGRGSHGNPGVLLGVGVAIGLRGGWYIRPQGRVSVLRGLHASLGASVGIGYRFRMSQ